MQGNGGIMSFKVVSFPCFVLCCHACNSNALFQGDDYATKMQIAVGVAVAIYFVILPFSLSKLQVLTVRFRVMNVHFFHCGLCIRHIRKRRPGKNIFSTLSKKTFPSWIAILFVKRFLKYTCTILTGNSNLLIILHQEISKERNRLSKIRENFRYQIEQEMKAAVKG
jgi:hypothetical protein